MAAVTDFRNMLQVLNPNGHVRTTAALEPPLATFGFGFAAETGVGVIHSRPLLNQSDHKAEAERDGGQL